MGYFAGSCGGYQRRSRLDKLVVGVSKLYNTGKFAIHRFGSFTRSFWLSSSKYSNGCGTSTSPSASMSSNHTAIVATNSWQSVGENL